MKTAEEKANKYAEETILAVYSDSELIQDFVQKQKKYAKVDFLAGYNEGQSNPKIKQLEWVARFVFSDELGIKAQTPFCTYTIIDMEDSGFAEGIYLSSIDDVDVEVSSFDEGKKLAQEDFERRVLQCLTIK